VQPITFWAYRLREDGRRLGKWRQHGQDRLQGVLLLDDARHPGLARNTRVARFVDPATGTDLFRPLTDAGLVRAERYRWVVVGTETIGITDDVAVAQTWVLVPQPDMA
jgi:hypothetical protein